MKYCPWFKSNFKDEGKESFKGLISAAGVVFLV
jgi:hypothetical protein